MVHGDRMVNKSKLLILSNGHGEDLIAARILEHLQQSKIELAVLPLVGEGQAYDHLNIPIIGQVQKLPSGGFIYMDGRQLWRDLQGGLLGLSLKQYKTIKQWTASGGKILAVGDIVPLLLAWLSGANYAFVGTAKSEYYLRDEYGWLAQTSRFYRYWGSYYLPWEINLMKSPRCQAVFPRDSLTAKVLKQHSIRVFDLGNPMMDNLEITNTESDEILTFVLLPGSRSPEAEDNWGVILKGVQGVVSALRYRRLRFLGAIAPSLSIAAFQDILLAHDWQAQETNLVFNQNNAVLYLSQNSYQKYLNQAQIGIAMAGTATEQLVGLGKPVIIIPGKGPQFTKAFAEAQTRLLGISAILVQQPREVAEAVQNLLNNPDLWLAINDNGQRRLGAAGAGKRIAECVVNGLCSS